MFSETLEVERVNSGGFQLCLGRLVFMACCKEVECKSIECCRRWVDTWTSFSGLVLGLHFMSFISLGRMVPESVKILDKSRIKIADLLPTSSCKLLEHRTLTRNGRIILSSSRGR
jgi:hypothetical protein